MKVRIDLTEEDFRRAIRELVERDMEMSLPTGKRDFTLTIEVKSKQNYKSEWENAQFRGYLEVSNHG